MQFKHVAWIPKTSELPCAAPPGVMAQSDHWMEPNTKEQQAWSLCTVEETLSIMWKHSFGQDDFSC